MYCTVNYTGNPLELVTRCERGRNNCKNPFEMSHKKGHQVANLKCSEKSRLESMIKVASPEGTRHVRTVLQFHYVRTV